MCDCVRVVAAGGEQRDSGPADVAARLEGREKEGNNELIIEASIDRSTGNPFDRFWHLCVRECVNHLKPPQEIG